MTDSVRVAISVMVAAIGLVHTPVPDTISAAGKVGGKSKSEIWMMPPSSENGARFRELFESNPDDWRRTRSLVAGVGYADHWLDAQFSDAELRTWLPRLNKWGLKLSLEVGAIKPWSTSGAKTFGIERKMWDRFHALGGRIYSIAMDEPLSAARDSLHESPQFAVEETAQFIALVRKTYPKIKIGDVEPYPSFQAADLLSFLDALQTRLAAIKVRGLDSMRLDVDWMHFRPGDPIGQAGWQGVHAVETECRKRRIPFSLIYWAADYPSLKQQGLATPETWETSILRQGREYAAVGGSPDERVIESWLDTPARSTPETAPGSFTKSVLDFCSSFR